MFKTDSQYRSISKYYDILNGSAAYDEYLQFILNKFKENGKTQNCRILDLACGTGEMTMRFFKAGHKVIALDLSPDMLTEASFKASDVSSDDIFFTCQDMRSFRLYSKTDAAVCLYDSLNYLLHKKDLAATFDSVHNALNDNGIFIFDVSTKERYEEYYGSNSFVFDYPELFCAWENDYNKEKKTCDFYLTIFTENNNGDYTRTDEHQRQRYYSSATLKKLLDAAGFDIIAVNTDKEVFTNTSDCDFNDRKEAETDISEASFAHRLIFTVKKRATDDK